MAVSRRTGVLIRLAPAAWAQWAKRIATALALVGLLTEEIVKYLWHHPEVEHVEVVLPALLLPPTADEPPPGQQMLVVPRWYEEQRRQAVFAATSLLYRNHALYAATAAQE